MRRRFCWVVILLGAFFALKGQGQGLSESGISGERAWQHLVAQVNAGPRVPGTPPHAKTLAYLESELRKTGARVTVDRFTITKDGKSYPLANVYADFGPVADRPEGMLAAHWDTRPIAEEDPRPENRTRPIPGANDGASGVAVLLEVARHLGDRPPQKPVRLAFWDGEDLGTSDATMFYGSRWYVRHRPLPRWGLLLDMVGDADLRIPQEAYSAHYAPDLTRRVWDTAHRLGYAATFPQLQGPPIRDDHVPFLERGVPFVDLIDFDYPYWHTLEDTPAHCSPRSLEIVGNVVLRVVRDLDK